MATEKGELTRDGIVASARRLFYEHGFDNTSFGDIVQDSGIVKGHIYHYFKSKDDILRAVVESRIDEFRVLLAQWNADYPDPRSRLLAFVGMVTGRAPELAEYGCPIGSLNTELGKHRRDLQQDARALFDLFRDWLAAQFSALGYRKDAVAMALHLLGRAQGIAVISHVYRDAALLERETEYLQTWLGNAFDAS